MEQPNKQNTQINISACLEAVNMYDAEIHRDRGGDPYAPPPHIQVVSPLEYWWTLLTKTGTSLAGNTMLLVAGLAGILIPGNVFRNIVDYYRAQPTFRVETVTDFATRATHTVTITEPSLYPLPADYWSANISIYVQLVYVMVVAYGISRLIYCCRPQKTNTVVPLTRANTGHLPANESLVRASVEPAHSSLMRSSEEPPHIQKALLLRVPTETPQQQEQLLRGIGTQK